MLFDLPPVPQLPSVSAQVSVQSTVVKLQKAETGISVFLTYAHADDRYVEATYKFLTDSGVQVFLDRYSMRVGEIDGQLIANLKRATYQLVFCTKSANDSKYVRKEVKFFEDSGGQQLPIVVDPMHSMEWFHFHLNKQNAILVDQIKDPAAAELAIRSRLKFMLGLDFGSPI